MKTQKIVTTLILVLIALLLVSCSLRNNPQKVKENITQNITTVNVREPMQNRVYDYDVVLSDNAKDVPEVLHLTLDIEKVFRITNKRNSEAVFEIPQLGIRERVGSGESKYIDVHPIRMGYYQMTLNGASYGTFQVK